MSCRRAAFSLVMSCRRAAFSLVMSLRRDSISPVMSLRRDSNPLFMSLRSRAMSSFVARFAPMSSAKALTSASACFSSKPASRSRRDAFSVSNATMSGSYAIARGAATRGAPYWRCA